MKKLLLVLAMGLALATTGFAQGRGGGSHSGGGRSFSAGGSYGGGHGSGGYSYRGNGGRSYGGGDFSYNGRGYGGRFSGQTARGGRFEGGFRGYRGGYGYGGQALDLASPMPPMGWLLRYPDPYYYGPYAYAASVLPAGGRRVPSVEDFGRGYEGDGDEVFRWRGGSGFSRR